MGFNYTSTPYAIVFDLLHKASFQKGLALFRSGNSSFILTWSNGRPPISMAELKPVSPKGVGSDFSGGYVGWVTFEAGFKCEQIEEMTHQPSEPLELFWECDGAIHIDISTQAFTIRGNASFHHDAAKIISGSSHRTALDAYPTKQLSSSSAQKPDFMSAVENIQRDIYEGNVYQVNISWHQKYKIQSPLQVFERLFSANPSRFASFLQYEAYGVISCSPELFLSITVKDNRCLLSSIPIKGTANQTDFLSRSELWNSSKERAELSMIVDMVRNDLGKVAVQGSVKVHHRRIRRCGDLLHAEQKVTAELRSNCRISDILTATFPPASVTGAPKVSAIKRIHKLEKTARGIYTGCIGYIGYDGCAQFSVAIRCLPFVNQSARLHIGSGIVYDSKPELEWLETLAKARAIQNILSSPS